MATGVPQMHMHMFDGMKVSLAATYCRHRRQQCRRSATPMDIHIPIRDEHDYVQQRITARVCNKWQGKDQGHILHYREYTCVTPRIIRLIAAINLRNRCREEIRSAQICVLKKTFCISRQYSMAQDSAVSVPSSDYVSLPCAVSVP